MNKNRIKESIIIATYAIILFLVLTNLNIVNSSYGFIVDLLNPIIYGFVFAYILKGPYNFIRDKVIKYNGGTSRFDKLKPAIALISSYTIFIGVIILLVVAVVPQLWSSINTLIQEISTKEFDKILAELKNLNDLNISSKELAEIWSKVEEALKNFATLLTDIISKIVPAITNFLVGFTTSITNSVIVFVFSLYFLAAKESLVIQVKKLFFAFLPEKVANYLVHVGYVVDGAFSKFITGQITEAFILGTLSFIGMTILNFPYALLVSIILGATNVIPIVGPIFGAFPATFIVFMADTSNPMKAIWFIVFIIVLQQIDGNLIYPRVVGSSIGLPGLWVMITILVGGNLFGIMGMLIGVPAVAVIYSLMKEVTNAKLKEKNIIISEKLDYQ
ncbi:hypothetical protein AN639_03955 [Candidatus Epulonipiscium fishelsonii]|uniref:Uncharacterized protein n=1 Tax=Candidatus Epulonipiscium fishelsonii TaxID=77094 RepID=A0ACC8X806_9FIRM|nr:hypothetical protein AN396_11825 [Epulopiscium sp. SCG-B11WGA-EpuloA1]ONI41126.1 hypothetical protein AN639_03955 [Epulopiscium sp. SCG-B05WGA-EpuloA1]